MPIPFQDLGEHCGATTTARHHRGGLLARGSVLPDSRKEVSSVEQVQRDLGGRTESHVV